MSHAVLLEGFIHQSGGEDDNSSSETLWKGHWRFMKDKKGILQFNYTKIGYEVPKDMLEYVSFMDPASVYSSSHPYKSSSSSKNKKRGRGRPPLAPLTPTSANPGQSLSSSVDPQSNPAPTLSDARIDQSKDNNEEGKGEVMDVEGGDIFPQDTKDDGNGTDGFQLVNLEAPSMDICDQNLAEENNQPPSDEPIIIPNCHPLAGVWKGNFSVTTAKGEERIDEIIFFHSMLGTEQKNRFKDLPPEPQFPYTLLKRIEPVKSLNEAHTSSSGGNSNANGPNPENPSAENTTQEQLEETPSAEKEE